MNAADSAPGLAAAMGPMLQAIAQGATLADMTGITPEQMEALYVVGQNLYAQDRYTEALNIFSGLVLRNHLERRYIHALAATLQMSGRHAEAVGYYGLASLLDLDDPRPNFHLCECLIALGHTDDAAKELQRLIAEEGQAPQHQALRERAEGLLALLRPNAASTPATTTQEP